MISCRHLLIFNLFRMTSSTCFESSSSSIPRRALRTENQWTDAACRLSCYNNPYCMAVQFTVSTRECFILGDAMADSQCGVEYSHYVKKTSCSEEIIPPLTPSTDYSSSGCKDLLDVADIVVNASNPCGTVATPSGKLPYIVEVVLNDGTQAFYPNQRTTITWDADIGTYKHTYKDFSQFISFARCIRAPLSPSADCACGSIPLTGPQSTQTEETPTYYNKRPACPSGYNLWAHYLFDTRTQPIQTPSISTRSTFCIKDTWFMWYKASYEDMDMVKAASCLRVPPAGTGK